MAGKSGVLFLGILLVFLALVSGAKRYQNENEADVRAMWDIGRSNVEFSKSLYKVLARNPGNIFFSPLSIHSILTMLSLGAKENTLEQLKVGLALPQAETAKIGYRHLNKNFRSLADKGVTVKIANKVYATKRAPLSSEYKQVTSDYFNAIAENVDFSNGEKVRNDINQWVESNTNNKIKDIVPSGTLSSDTAMVLVNAVYFKGKWLTEFDPAHTATGTFYGVKGQEQVKFMQQTSEFRYFASDSLKARVLELPYNGNKLSLLILLPTERNGFKAMEKLLETSDHREYLPGADDRHDVKVKLPRFRLEQETPLAGPLAELGMTDMFGNNADLSGLTSSSVPLKVSKVLHKAFLEVNEEGSEAAASTVMAVQTLSLVTEEIQPIEFYADHPFIFMIYHKQSNSILFMGRYLSAGEGEGVQSSLPQAPSRKPNRNQNRNRGQQGQQGHQGGSGHNGKVSSSHGNRGTETQSTTEYGVDLRSGAGPTGPSNVKLDNNQGSYDLLDK